MCSLVALFLCGLAMSIVMVGWQCRHHFLSSQFHFLRDCSSLGSRSNVTKIKSVLSERHINKRFYQVALIAINFWSAAIQLLCGHTCTHRQTPGKTIPCVPLSCIVIINKDVLCIAIYRLLRLISWNLTTRLAVTVCDTVGECSRLRQSSWFYDAL